MSSLPSQIKSLRLAKKLSQAEVATKAGLMRQAYVRTENAAVDMRLSTLESICYGLDAELLLVPKALRLEVLQFIQSGGRYLELPPGVEAPKSIVDL